MYSTFAKTRSWERDYHETQRKSPALKPISILVVDDQTLVRAGIRALLEKFPEVEVTGEAADAREALRMIREHQPDLVLMDIALPGLNGLNATACISAEFPGVRVVVLSMYSDEKYVREAINAGAVGYLVKGSVTAELENAITTLAQGDEYFTPLVSRHILKDHPEQSVDSALIESLTSRQREILRLIAERNNTKEIAYVLSISVKTVETHRAHLMRRLGIYDVPGLVRLAIRTGLVSLEE
jgi:DNA-binding NarL/FixJ family response regulator